MKIKYSSLIFTLCLALALTACDSESPVNLTATYSSIENQVFSSSCALGGCHDKASSSGGLNLEGSTSYLNLISIQSKINNNNLLVMPYSADESILLQLFEKPDSNSTIPEHNDVALGQEELDVIRDWIQQGAVVATIESIESGIFSRVCTGCHSEPSAAGELNLVMGESYKNLVNVKRPYGEEIRVVAGDAKNSFLIDKLQGNELGNSRGERMPLSRAPLPNGLIDTIIEWIEAGAMTYKNNL